jgi:hypothetical protein
MSETIRDIWFKGTYHNVAFWVCLAVSLFLIITAFFIPPKAVVDSSVIACVGELFAYASLSAFLWALSKGVDAKITKGDTEIKIQNPDNNKTNTIDDEQ